MIPTFIPSKNRAAQLLLLLESLEKNAPGMFRPHIMWKASDDEFERGYKIVQKHCAGKDYVWMPEYKNDGETQFYDFLEMNANKGELVCLYSDDCIFYRENPVSEKTLRHTFDQGDVWSFTYRLGSNITIRDYVTNTPTNFPRDIYAGNNMMRWNWGVQDFWDMFGFTVGFDGYIYRAKDLLELSERKHFNNKICFWENMICRQFQDKKTDRYLMASPEQSCVFVQQINVTHNLVYNNIGYFNISTKKLNDKLLDGYKINLLSMFNDHIPNCTHGEEPFDFIRL